jgi:hypothetical protein
MTLAKALIGCAAMIACMPFVLALYAIDARERVLEEAGR